MRSRLEKIFISYPADDPLVTEELWLAAAQARFSGRVIVGRDLMEI